MRFAGVLFLRWAGILLYRLGCARAVIWWNRRIPKVLLYHACEPEETDFTRDLHSNITPDEFDRHLRFLERHYQVVDLSALATAEFPDRAVAITFDDGYRSVFTNALPLLNAHRYPATVFLVSDVVDNGAIVWVNELNWLLRNCAAVTRPVLHAQFDIDESCSAREAINRVRATRTPAEISAALREIRKNAGVDERALAGAARLYLSWDEIATMLSHRICFGNHTATHPNLGMVRGEEALSEIQRAQDCLVNRIGSVTAFAYPFGTPNADSRRVAASLGFVCIAEVGGLNKPLDLRRLGRTPVYGCSDARFFAEIEVVGPMKGRMATSLRKLAGRFHRLVRWRATPSIPNSYG